MEAFASLQDVIDLWRPLKPEEQERVRALLPIVSASLRYEAQKVGRDLDEMAQDRPALGEVLRSVTVDVIRREMMTPTDREPVIQSSESALGYSVSNTFLVPGGGLFIKNTELAKLGLRRQRYGAMEMYG